MEKLTKQEEAAMQAIWKAGKGFVKISGIPCGSDPPYTTLASTIKNLEKKGFVEAKKIGNVYEYSPSIGEDEYAKKFMNSFVKDYFENSYKDLVTFFAKDKKISPDDLKEIIRMIEGK